MARCGRKANSSKTRSIVGGQRKSEKESKAEEIGTHCNTSKLDPTVDDRIVKVVTVVFLFLWFFLKIDISYGPAAHPVSTVACKVFEGRWKGLGRTVTVDRALKLSKEVLISSGTISGAKHFLA
jgi:hypothetical protein